MSQQEAVFLWEQARTVLSQRDETNNAKAEGFLSYLVPQTLENGTLVFSTRLPFAKQHIEESYLGSIQDALLVSNGAPLEVAIFVLDEPLATTAFAPGVTLTPSTSAASATFPLTGSPAAVPTAGQAVNSAREGLSAQEMPFEAAFEADAFLPAQSTTISGQVSQISQTPTLSPSASPAPGTPLTQTPFSPVPSAQVSPLQTTSPQAQSPQDYKTYTFETFVVGDSNDFAFSAAQGVAETPGLRFNPLFIYGRSGLGKTHLLLAIRDFINRYHPSRKVIYAPTSDFVNDFTSAMASINKDLGEFRKKYYSCDVLLLDDVQYLEGKEATTNALFDIFNVFIDQKKQIVLSADRAPTEIDMDERFTSRFGSGVTAGIQPPSFEMKLAIFNNYVRYYCSMIGDQTITVPSEVSQHIISLSGSNIRELEGAISSICFAISRRGSALSHEISIEEAEQIVGKVFLHNENRQISVTTIQQEVERHFNISHADMIGPHRSKNITYPRQIAMYLSRRLTNKSYPEIGKLFGNKDHTTVMYALRNVEDKFMNDMEKKIEIERLAEKITQ